MRILRRPAAALTCAAAALAALTAALSGCTIGNQPPVALAQLPGSTTVHAKVHAGPITVGVDLNIVRYHEPDSLVESQGRRDIRYIAKVLHAQEVGLDFSLVIPSARSNSVEETTYVTPTLTQLKALTEAARSYKLRIQYRVLFWVESGSGNTTKLNPPDLAAFFSSLLTAETPFLQLAQAEGVGEFVVGTEKTSIEHALNWPGFFTSAAKVYHGALSYAEWGGEPGSGGAVWGGGCLMPDKECGITFYPKMSLGETPSVAQLTSSMESDLRQLPAASLAKMEIDEVGIPATAHAFAEPYQWNLAGPRDDHVQADWFTAACAAVHAEGMRGLSVWDMPLAVDPSAAPAANNIFTGRPAVVAAIQACTKGARGSG